MDEDIDTAVTGFEHEEVFVTKALFPDQFYKVDHSPLGGWEVFVVRRVFGKITVPFGKVALEDGRDKSWEVVQTVVDGIWHQPRDPSHRFFLPLMHGVWYDSWLGGQEPVMAVEEGQRSEACIGGC